MTHDLAQGAQDHGHDGSDHDRPAAGRRALSDRLPVQRRAAEPGSTASVSASWAAVLDDPFGMHLAPRQVQRRAEGATADGVDVQETAARGVAGSGGALPYLDTIQRSFGRHAVGDISAHTGGAAAAASEAIGARAYATGNAVAFAGAPDLHTAAHEAAHVVQQRAGVHLKGGVGETGDVYERHADEVADAVVAGRSAEALLDAHAGGGAGGGVQAVQLKKDVFSTAAFANPTNYLKGDDDENKVLEEPGAQGILGEPDQVMIKEMADPDKRGALIDKMGDMMNSISERKQRYEKKSRQLTSTGDLTGAHQANVTAKECETQISLLGGLLAGLLKVDGIESAAVFYRSHTLELGKLGAMKKVVQNKGAIGGKTHTFHTDAGLIKIDAATLHGDQQTRTQKAALLNGPFGTGFVRGHNTIKNMKHRFIDHVHVNKDDDNAGIDIYNTNDESKGETAEAYLEKANQVDGMLHGNDTKAINTKIGAVNDADVQTLKDENPELVKQTEE